SYPHTVLYPRRHRGLLALGSGLVAALPALLLALRVVACHARTSPRTGRRTRQPTVRSGFSCCRPCVTGIVAKEGSGPQREAKAYATRNLMAANLRANRRNPRKLPCQGRGRGFESLRPLQR